jgi:hypothetical protein
MTQIWTPHEQEILTKFEFFPIKCRIQRATEIFSIVREELLAPPHQKHKVTRTLPRVKSKVLASWWKLGS